MPTPAPLTLVTGATGFLGGVLVRALLARGLPVRVLVRSGGPNQGALAGLAIEVCPGDVRDPGAVAAAMQGVGHVFHCAAKISITGDRDGSVHATNVEGARIVASAARIAGVRRFVHVASVHALNLEEPGPVDEDSPPAGPHHAVYDRSKAEGLAAVLEEAERGLSAVAVLPSGILGPWDLQPSRMGRVLLDLARRRLPSLVDGGFDWVDVRDVVDALLAAQERGVTGRTYIASGSWASIREVADTAAAASGVPAPRFTTPMPLARLVAPLWAAVGPLILRREPGYTPEGLRALRSTGRLTHARATAELGYAPRPLLTTMQDTYASFVEHGMLTLAGPRSVEPRR